MVNKNTNHPIFDINGMLGCKMDKLFPFIKTILSIKNTKKIFFINMYNIFGTHNHNNHIK